MNQIRQSYHQIHDNHRLTCDELHQVSGGDESPYTKLGEELGRKGRSIVSEAATALGGLMGMAGAVPTGSSGYPVSLLLGYFAGTKAGSTLAERLIYTPEFLKSSNR